MARYLAKKLVTTHLNVSKAINLSHGISNQSRRSFSETSNTQYNHNFTFLDEIWKGGKDPATKYDVVLLHCPGDTLIHGLCNHANCVICADGGANALYRGGDNEITPYAIVGDLDGIDKNVLDHFVSQGSIKVHKPEQNSNDFEKSLKYLMSLNNRNTNANPIICWGAFGGRFDHEMQAFNVINKLADPSNHPNIMLMAPKNFAFVLLPGKHNIQCAQIQGEICGLLPLYGDATVSTSGLKWNLDNQALKFGGLVSSSNELVSYNIDIQTDNLIVFHTTIDIRNDKESWQW